MLCMCSRAYPNFHTPKKLSIFYRINLSPYILQDLHAFCAYIQYITNESVGCRQKCTFTLYVI